MKKINWRRILPVAMRQAKETVPIPEDAQDAIDDVEVQSCIDVATEEILQEYWVEHPISSPTIRFQAVDRGNAIVTVYRVATVKPQSITNWTATPVQPIVRGVR